MKMKAGYLNATYSYKIKIIKYHDNDNKKAPNGKMCVCVPCVCVGDCVCESDFKNCTLQVNS